MATPRNKVDTERTRENPSPGQFDARAQLRRIEQSLERGSTSRPLWLSLICLVWLLAAVYYFLFPSVYISRWSLIVPPSNSGASVSIDSIGQASTTPGQPFGTVTLSPKAIYREIATSDQVRNRAAENMRVKPGEFGRVRVRLIDETSLMMMQINGRTAEQARAKGRALIEALGVQLDQLRRDEYEKRALMVRDSMKIYQANLDQARERLIAFQRETGLQSLDQFKDASATLEVIRRRLAERRAERDKVVAEQQRLMGRLGLEPQAAAAGLRLAADPAFARLAASYADSASAVQENALRFGPRHPAQIAATMRRDGAFAEIEKIATRSNVDSKAVDLHKLVLLVNGSDQSALLRTLVAGEASMIGVGNEVAGHEREEQRLTGLVARLGLEAVQFEALRKDLVVAEAVYASGAARLDTNRADLFSSYPLVQVLADPELPENRAQPRLLYAVVAGLAGTMLVLFGWGAAWARMSFNRRRSRSV